MRIQYALPIIESLLELGWFKNTEHNPDIGYDYEKRVRERFLNFRLDSWLIIKIDNFNNQIGNIGDVRDVWIVS